MDKTEKRVEILRAMVERMGGPAAFAKKMSQDSADKPIDPTYVSQLLNGHRKFGEKSAENMCKRAGLPPGYFDREGTSDPDLKVQENITLYNSKDKLIEEVVALMRTMSRDGKLMLKERATVLAEQHPANKQASLSR